MDRLGTALLPEAPLPPQPHGQRVLLVEADPADARAIVDALSEGHLFPVDAVATLEEAVASLRAQAPGVILLGLEVPDADGLSGLERLLAESPQTPVVMLTGSDGDRLDEQALAMGAQDLVAKREVSSGVLQRVLRHAIDRQRHVQGIESLARDLKDANQALEETRRDLSQANRLLEATVHERTRAFQELATLYEVSSAISSTLDYSSILAKLARHCRKVMKANACAILVRDSRGQLEVAAAVGVKGGLPSAPVRDLHGLLGRSLKGSVPVLAQLADLEPHQPFLEAARDEGYHSLFLIPLSYRKRGIGLLVLYYLESHAGNDDEIRLATAIARQAAGAIENSRLYQSRLQVEEMLRGRLIPTFLEFDGVEAAFQYVPSIDVASCTGDLSGDFLDLIPIRDDTFGLIIADVTGKGPAAAAQALRVKHIVENQAASGASPGQILARVNGQLTRRTEGRIDPVKIFYAEVSLSRREMRFACAGQEPALLLDPDTQELTSLHVGNMLVGAFQDVEYREAVQPIRKGQCLVMYTDGVTGARSPEGDYFGVDRLQHALEKERDFTPSRLATRVYLKVYHFARGHITDDFALLVVRF